MVGVSEANEWKRNSLGGSVESRRSAVCRAQEFRPKPCQGKDGKKGIQGIASETQRSCGWTEKCDSGTGVVVLTSVPDETEGRNDGDGKKRWCHRGGVW